ncbi:SIMPL domain-containing protein [Thalassotalea mangrovi]|uniref:DUF541 domain-containing protein n=1 Tax=Thalassotalea mangrovi TaxID=2572245 RepID=A0A4U1B394_9GAMM|nr:SIMPL domain-containing protein [Thalassotalea mangrovi]TKB44125.1 DUF541 domain-containing protein [Thalassotalea mangrovi]
MKFIITITILFMSFSSIAGSELPNHRHISITGSASLTTIPDLAVIELNVESVKDTSFDAKRDVDLKVNNFLKGLPDFNISNKDVSASNIVTEPNIDYSDEGEPLVNGYVASRTLKVTLSQLKDLNKLLNFALSAELNEIEDIVLKSTKANSLRKEAKKLAIQDAKDRANELAEAFDSQLGKIYSINEMRNSSNYEYKYGANESIEMIEVTGSRVKKVDLVPGKYLEAEITFEESVRVVFDLDVN